MGVDLIGDRRTIIFRSWILGDITTTGQETGTEITGSTKVTVADSMDISDVTDPVLEESYSVDTNPGRALINFLRCLFFTGTSGLSIVHQHKL